MDSSIVSTGSNKSIALLDSDFDTLFNILTSTERDIRDNKKFYDQKVNKDGINIKCFLLGVTTRTSTSSKPGDDKKKTFTTTSCQVYIPPILDEDKKNIISSSFFEVPVKSPLDEIKDEKIIKKKLQSWAVLNETHVIPARSTCYISVANADPNLKAGDIIYIYDVTCTRQREKKKDAADPNKPDTRTPEEMPVKSYLNGSLCERMKNLSVYYIAEAYKKFSMQNMPIPNILESNVIMEGYGIVFNVYYDKEDNKRAISNANGSLWKYIETKDSSNFKYTNQQKVDVPTLTVDYSVVQWERGFSAENCKKIKVELIAYSSSLSSFKLRNLNNWIDLIPCVLKFMDITVIAKIDVTKTSGLMVNLSKNKDPSKKIDFGVVMIADLVIPNMVKFLYEYGVPVSEKVAKLMVEQNKSPVHFPDDDPLFVFLNEHTTPISEFVENNRGKVSYRVLFTNCSISPHWKKEIAKLKVEDGDKILLRKSVDDYNIVFDDGSRPLVFACFDEACKGFLKGNLDNFEAYFNVTKKAIDTKVALPQPYVPGVVVKDLFDESESRSESVHNNANRDVADHGHVDNDIHNDDDGSHIDTDDIFDLPSLAKIDKKKQDELPKKKVVKKPDETEKQEKPKEKRPSEKAHAADKAPPAKKQNTKQTQS